MQLVRPGPRLRANDVSVYVDESIHDSYDFVVTAFVFASPGLDEAVSATLSSSGLAPGLDEFKSGVFMRTNPGMQQARNALIGVLGERAKLAILITSARFRSELGDEILQALREMISRNGLEKAPLTVYFDRGLFLSANQGHCLAGEIPSLAPVNLKCEQDSRIILGLQVADAAAHMCAQILREGITGTRKQIDIGGGPDGLPQGTQVPLGSELLMSLRYSFFVRPFLIGRRPTAGETLMNPLVILNEEDEELIMRTYHRPELLGWGVFLSDDLGERVRTASEESFSSLWLGCMH